LVLFNTADQYVHYILNHALINRKKYVPWIRFINRLSIPHKLGLRHKLLLLSLLRGMKETDLDTLAAAYCQEVLAQNLNQKVIQLLHQLRQQNPDLQVLLISGGYEIYLRHLARLKEIQACAVIGNQLLFKKGVFTGFMQLPECMQEYKVIRLKQTGWLARMQPEHTAVISDSFTDLPLFSLATHKYVTRPDTRLKQLVGCQFESLD